MARWLTRFQDRMRAGHTVAETATINVAHGGRLRVFVAERRGTRRVILVCDGREGSIYTGFDADQMALFRRILVKGRDELHVTEPDRSQGRWSRFAALVLRSLAGRRIADLGAIPCRHSRLTASIWERSGQRHLLLTFRLPMAGRFALLDAGAVDQLMAALDQGAAQLDGPRPPS